MSDSTSRLIERLSAGIAPMPRRLLDRHLAMALLTGAAVALLLLVISLGLRPDLAAAATDWVLWTKLGYAAALGVGGYLLCAQAARPDAHPRWRVVAVLIPVACAATAAMLRTVSLPAELRSTEWLGDTAAICPLLIGLLSLPCLLALCFVMRRAAPTRLRWAGFCAGLLAGAIAMLVYALHCPEAGLAFIATWYTLGMCLPAALGATFGPLLLRWR